MLVCRRQVDAADDGRRPIDNEDLAMIALIERVTVPGIQGVDRVELEQGDSGFPELVEEGLRRPHRAVAIVNDVYRDAGLLLGGQEVT
jgi:hypothetical protein